jgi:hypothetical protein
LLDRVEQVRARRVLDLAVTKGVERLTKDGTAISGMPDFD